MSDLKGVMKGGWHPKGRDGAKESWRGDFKGINQVAGWMGKGKTADSQAAKEHVSRPLATLKDPSSFGPPPKNVNYHGGAALPNEITPHRNGLGAPLALTQITDTGHATTYAQAQEEEEEQSRTPLPALPYRADRTGLRTDNLPPPPTHRDIQQSVAAPPPSRSPVPSAQPRLPPRLPSRQNTTSPPADEPPPPAYDVPASQSMTSPYINQSAVSGLGKAGISVPGLGIGSQSETNPWKEERSRPQASGTNQLSELQSRFARMNSSSQDTGVVSSPPTTQTESPSQVAMPSWKQSQSALATAQNLKTNPQNVSLADAQSAAQTANQAQRSANAFREKHADSIAKGQAKAKAWDQKYKVTSKLNKFLDEHSEDPANQQAQGHQQQPSMQHTPQQYPNGQHYQPPTSSYPPTPPVQQYPAVSPSPVQSPPPTELSASIARKPPPPPAPRKPAKLQAPPPIPTGTKPSLG